MDRIFRSSYEDFDLKEAQDFFNTHKNTIAPRLRLLKDYYDGKHAILNRKVSDISKPNNKLVNNFCDYIVNQSSSYFMGTPVSYNVLEEEKPAFEQIENILKYNDEADTNAQHAENMAIYGTSYELLYIDKDGTPAIDVRFAVVNPEEMFIVYDRSLSFSPVYAVRYFPVENHEYHVEVYTGKEVATYKVSHDNWEYVKVSNHFFGDVPATEFFNNLDKVGDYEKVLSLVDEYNLLQSDSANDFQYFSDAYLFLKGTTLDEDSAKKMRENKIINVADADADASFLIKEIQDQALENLKTRIVEDIHKFSGVPNLTDENFAGNLSGVAIKYKLLGLDNLATRKERRFKKALQRRLELMFNLLFVRGKLPANNSYYDIDIVFKRTLPQNVYEQSQMARNLLGIASLQTILSQLDFVDDAKREIQTIEEERTANPDSFEPFYGSLLETSE